MGRAGGRLERAAPVQKPSGKERTRTTTYVVGCAAAALLAASPSAAQEPPPDPDFGAFAPAGETAPRSPEMRGFQREAQATRETVLRTRAVEIETEFFNEIADGLEQGAPVAPVRLNLFPDTIVEGLIEHRDFTPSGWSWGGGLVGDPHGSAAVAVNGSTVHGIIRSGGRIYTVRSDGAGGHEISESVRNRVLEGAEPFAPPRRATGDPPAPSYVDDPSRVDIAVFYTSAARREAGGTDEIHALIDAWIADTNAAYTRSGINHRLNLVYRGRVTYTERRPSDDESPARQALMCLVQDEGCLSTVPDLKTEYSADLVHLLINSTWPESAETFNCGIAVTRGDYGVTEMFCGSDTFAHEIGHNSGATHDRWTEYNEDCETDRTVACLPEYVAPYSFGYVNQNGLSTTSAIETRWRTLMSYGGQCRDAGPGFCSVLMRFSNPDHEWQGDRLGVLGSTGPSSFNGKADAAKRGPSDVARTHREFAFDLANRIAREEPDLVVKGFRADPSRLEPGGTIRLTGVIENQGIRTGPITDTTATWCRTSGTSCPRSSAIFVGSTIPPFEPGDRLSQSIEGPGPTSNGTHTYLMCVTPAPGEELTANNCAAPVTVEVGTVDLSYSMTISPTSTTAGGTINVSGSVRNSGTLKSSAASFVYGYIDQNEDPVFQGREYLLALRPGTSTRINARAEAPEDAGAYWYFGCLSSKHVEFDCVFESLTVRRPADFRMNR